MEVDGKKLFQFSTEAMKVMFRTLLSKFDESGLVEALDEMSEHMELTEEQVQLAMRLGLSALWIVEVRAELKRRHGL